METLFKSDDRIFFIKDDELCEYIIPIYKPILDAVLENVPLICEQPIIYHLIDNNHKYPVYYEYKDRCIIFDDNLNYYYINYDAYQKDYTQVNLNKLLNGNII